MKVSLERGKKLFKALTFKTADTWDSDMLLKKIAKLPTIPEEELEVKDEDLAKLRDKLIAAVKAKEEITITTEAAEETPKSEKSEKKAKKPAADDDDDDEPAPKKQKAAAKDEEEEDEEPAPKKKAKPAADEDDEEEDEDAKPAKKKAAAADDDDEEEEEAPKKKGKAPPKSAGGEGKPGVIATIVNTLKAATEDKPVTKKKILKVLVAAFPDRDESSMQKTVNVQVPNRVKADKKLNVVSVELEGGKVGYYIAEGKVAKKAAEDDDDDE